MSFTTPKLMADRRFTAPTPMMAVVFAWVVDTGMPNTELKSSEREAAIPAEKPWYFSSFTTVSYTHLTLPTT